MSSPQPTSCAEPFEIDPALMQCICELYITPEITPNIKTQSQNNSSPSTSNTYSSSKNNQIPLSKQLLYNIEINQLR